LAFGTAERLALERGNDMARKRVASLTSEDMGALRAFGLASLTTDSVYVEPRWDYLPQRGVVSVMHKRRTAQEVCDAVAAWADEWANVAPMTGAATLAASVDPMGAHRASLALEHAATQLLACYGDKLPRPDVWSRRHHAHVARPDVVAFRGLPRYELPQPCRYGRTGLHAASETRQAVRLVNVSDTPEWAHVAVQELLTTLPGTGLTRQAWRGHRRVTLALAGRRQGAGVRAARAAAAAARQAHRQAQGAGKRGKAVSPDDMATASLPRAIAARGLADVVAALEARVRLAADGQALTFGSVSVSVLGAAQVMTGAGRAYPVREWARRAALAGVTAE
jgi:hypothetical protein